MSFKLKIWGKRQKMMELLTGKAIVWGVALLLFLFIARSLVKKMFLGAFFLFVLYLIF
jgi:hypothetical protein